MRPTRTHNFRVAALLEKEGDYSELRGGAFHLTNTADLQCFCFGEVTLFLLTQAQKRP